MPDEPILAIWDRLLQPAGNLPAEVARYVLRLGLPDADQARITDLSEKAQNNQLSSDERAELEAYIHATAFLTILQSRARVATRNQPTGASHGAPAA